MSLHAVILAGGSGTRFWPLSRAKKPKQFLALATGRPLIAETFLRVEPLSSSARTWVVCGKDHAAAVRAALPNLPEPHLVVEPVARNTAPAIGLACVHALREDPDATLMVLPSDHHIARPDAFRDALQTAARACQGGDLLTLGIKPARPETGYGYLRRGAEKSPGVFAVEAFVEKPDAATAQQYVRDPAYAWNAGIFVFRADAMLDALRRHLPAVHAGLTAAGDFAALPSISIDYGVMEPESKGSGRIALVPGDFGWSDVGSFAALPEVRQLDARGNALSGDTLAIDCDGCVVLAEAGRLVAAVGLEGVCVIDAGDAVLVVPRDRAQDVRAVVDALKASGRFERL
ncbi:MAG TPA: mannose-1-phosphate guanylyltransferase [Myxococcales bacterium]|nr:mannose-1-phosphate guanylyltransferase [Myxococcales bacterium]